MFEMLIKASTYNMPLATAVASSFANYAKLPSDYDMMLYWWVPDPTFLRPWLFKIDQSRLIAVPFAKNQLRQWWLREKTTGGQK